MPHEVNDETPHCNKLNDEGGEERRRRRGGATEPPDEANSDTSDSMASSVTRHAPFTQPTEFNPLLHGIDSLDLSVEVDWGDDFELLKSKLDQYKALAKNTKGILFPGFGDDEIVIQPNGRQPNYAYTLQLNEFILWIAAQKKSKNQTPNVYVSCSSKMLWKYNLEEVILIIETWINCLGGDVLDFKVSRFDMCADFHIPGGIAMWDIFDSRVPSHLEYDIQGKGTDFQTFYHGAKGAKIMLRIYNKHKEMKNNGQKNWFLPLWGLEDSEDVWRIEFQIRREACKEMEVNSPVDLFVKKDDIWAYLTEKWVSLRVPSNDTNVSRRELWELWKAVQQSSENPGISERINRRYKAVPPSTAWYVSHLSGCLKGYAVRIGEHNLQKAIVRFSMQAKEHWDSKATSFEEECKILSIKLGLNPDEFKEGAA